MIEDERLELIFTCCHPGLALEAQVELTLRALVNATARVERSERPWAASRVDAVRDEGRQVVADTSMAQARATFWAAIVLMRSA